jgi:hypothetical protein
MQRDDYFAMIGHARGQHIWVRTTTNASLLRLNDNYRKMIDADLRKPACWHRRPLDITRS